MEAIRDAAGPKTYILGCGIPIGPGIGTVNAARISADAGPAWAPNMNDKHNIPGARNMVSQQAGRQAGRKA